MEAYPIMYGPLYAVKRLQEGKSICYAIGIPGPNTRLLYMRLCIYEAESFFWSFLLPSFFLFFFFFLSLSFIFFFLFRFVYDSLSQVIESILLWEEDMINIMQRDN